MSVNFESLLPILLSKTYRKMAILNREKDANNYLNIITVINIKIILKTFYIKLTM